VSSFATRNFGWTVALLGALGTAQPLHAQLEIGTWVRKAATSGPAMTMKIEACCNGGRRLSYRTTVNGKATVLVLETRLDGKEAPVLMDGKPSGETMAITRVDAHHATNVLKLNGTQFGTSKATLSADGKTLTVENDFNSASGGQPVGKTTEVWVKQ